MSFPYHYFFDFTKFIIIMLDLFLLRFSYFMFLNFDSVIIISFFRFEFEQILEFIIFNGRFMHRLVFLNNFHLYQINLLKNTYHFLSFMILSYLGRLSNYLYLFIVSKFYSLFFYLYFNFLIIKVNISIFYIINYFSNYQEFQ